MEISGSVYPRGVQLLVDLRQEGYVYVDMTGYIPVLSGKKSFLCRPRQYGKSLLPSTSESYFPRHFR